ncbi:MAG: hypothetical protein FJZ01_22605 [Candidatus Sericytochromatia bacterium]|nr:hypothetical protein [Candidatus Tanganyikabacteria bacterium]
MESMMQNDAALKQLSDLENQLRMFSKIKELYNVDFDLEIKKIEKRVDQIRQAIKIRDNIRPAM